MRFAEPVRALLSGLLRRNDKIETFFPYLNDIAIGQRSSDNDHRTTIFGQPKATKQTSGKLKECDAF